MAQDLADNKSTLLHKNIDIQCIPLFHVLTLNIDSGNGLVSSGNKPLSKLMVTQISVATWHHLATMS